MRKVAGLVLTILLTAAMSFAQNGTPSSKATAAYNTAVACTGAAQSTIIGATLPQTFRRGSGCDPGQFCDRYVQHNQSVEQPIATRFAVARHRAVYPDNS